MAKSFALYKNAEKLGNNLSRTQINQRYQKTFRIKSCNFSINDLFTILCHQKL